MKQIRQLCCFVLCFSAALYGAGRWWSKLTPKGESFKCQPASSEEEMIRVLERAGWNTSRIPDTQWQREEAVVIAPEHWYMGMEIYFIGVNWRDNQYVVDYGWRPIPDEQTVRNPDGSYSRTSGSHDAGPETIVVAFSKEIASQVQACSAHPPE